MRDSTSVRRSFSIAKAPIVARGYTGDCVAAKEEALAAIERFLASASRPVLVEAGEAEFPLEAGSYALEAQGAFLHVSAWTKNRQYRRRILGIKQQRPGRLDLAVARIGRPPGAATIFDAAYARNREVQRRGQREKFREELRLMLRRQFPDWRLAELSTAPDLAHSLSPAYPRGALRRATSGVAVIGAPEGSANADGVLTFGLIWLDYLRRRDPEVAYRSLAVFLPEQNVRSAALRAQWLDPATVDVWLFAIRDGIEQPCEIADSGNLETRLEAPSASTPPPTPEGELERIVHSNVSALDPALLPEPVYRQAPAIAGCERGVADLLAMDCASRLAVIELKAAQDVHLPLQALDYWIRVRWHARRGDFARRGYFPERAIAPRDPVLYLVAPAFEFHPTTETLLRFLDPAIPVVRLGLGANWRENLKVLFRQGRHEHSATTA